MVYCSTRCPWQAIGVCAMAKPCHNYTPGKKTETEVMQDRLDAILGDVRSELSAEAMRTTLDDIETLAVYDETDWNV